MATPTSGQISMGDMRTHITRGASAISMSEVRTRYGGSGQINFSDLYKSEGFVITAGTQTGKFGDTDGWDGTLIGSVSPDEGNGRVSLDSGSWLANLTEFNNSSNCISYFYSNSTNFVVPTSSTYRGSTITRYVVANTARTITATFHDASLSYCGVGYAMPTSGTLHCLVKF